MIVFNIISLLGGLAMFLYGMRLMSGNLRESSSGTLKKAMEKVTNNPIKAFFLGVIVTAIIQSSTATIVITSGLVAAGIITLDQSLGVIIGANVGTTVTGQIIRLLDLNSGENPILQMFKPSTLAPVALIIGIVLLMFCKFNKSDSIGGIAIGFGILFSGLLNMTESVHILTENGVLSGVFAGLEHNPVLGYLTGAGVAFILQSSSATVGILQAFSLSGGVTFGGLYVILVGIYLGDCVTTAIVCSIGAKADAKRVGIVNILYNLGKTVLVLVIVNIVRAFGLLDSIWSVPLSSGGIANTNTIFNLGCAILLLPIVKILAKISRKIVKDSDKVKGKYADKIDSLNPVFFNTPALALRSCYDILRTMLLSAENNVKKAIENVENYDAKRSKEISEEEENIDMLADRVSGYLAQLSSHLSIENHILIFEQYFKLVSDFERIGDYAWNIDQLATKASQEPHSFSSEAIRELGVIKEL
ncbi:MAG: Na/Pi cotransporter family protein, partial [Clostridia bacterium]|nr:Na/Pi cotransporter family protein [Clostridia bacterium]